MTLGTGLLCASPTYSSASLQQAALPCTLQCSYQRTGGQSWATLTFQQLHYPRLHHADDRDVGVGPRHSLHSIASTHQRGSAITPCNAPATVLPRTWQYDANVYPPEERTEAPGLCTKLRAWTLLAAPAGKLTR